MQQREQFNSDIWGDILIAGTEILGQVIGQRKLEGFRARSLIAWNTSDARLQLTPGGVVIPPKCTEFVARLKPATEAFVLSVMAAPTVSGEVYIYLTEESLRPSVATL